MQYNPEHFKGHKNMKCLVGRNLFQNYQIKGMLGSGQNYVLLVEDVLGKEYAIKEIAASVEDIKKEINFLKHLKHDYIIKYIDSCILSQETNEFTTQTLGYICMERAQCNLAQFSMENRNKGILIEQTLSAFAYLQKNRIAHCDVKPANILVMQEDLFKICDVGSSKNHSSIVVDQIGTKAYMSPEMMNGETIDLCLSDVYSLGLVYFQMFFNKKFSIQERQSDKTVENYIAYTLQDKDNDISKLLRKMLVTNPQGRMRFTELMRYWNSLQIQQQQQPQQLTQQFMQPAITEIKEIKTLPKLRLADTIYKSQSPERKKTYSQYNTLSNSQYQSKQKSDFKIKRTQIRSNQVNVLDFFHLQQRRVSPQRVSNTPLKLSPLSKKRANSNANRQQQQIQFFIKLQN